VNTPAPTLIIGIGNPSRGDDALGPLAIERLAGLDLPDVELLTDFQLQIEYVLDLQQRARVVFIDAAESAPAPYVFDTVSAHADPSYTSHELSPAALLHACAQTWGTPPPAWVLAIHGENWSLGQAPSATALDNLDTALLRLRAFLATSLA
jgi:hydrogenase maturation protease